MNRYPKFEECFDYDEPATWESNDVEYAASALLGERIQGKYLATHVTNQSPMFDPVLVNCVMGIIYYIYHCHCWLSSETFAYHSFVNGIISFVQILYFGSILSGFEWAAKFEGIRMGRIVLDVL